MRRVEVQSRAFIVETSPVVDGQLVPRDPGFGDIWGQAMEDIPFPVRVFHALYRLLPRGGTPEHDINLGEALLA